MADSATTRKRSRSPTDADQHKDSKPKRLNLGASPSPELSTTKLPELDDKGLNTTDSNDPSESASHKDTVMQSANGADTASNGGHTDPDASKSGSGDSKDASAGPAVPQAHINMRCLIVTQDASIIIGKGGAHVNEIRQKSGAKVMVSESIPGNPERILNVGGPLDAVSKAFGLIVRRINDEPFDVPSVPGSRAVTIKFMIPNSRMGSVIGKGGTKIKEIQEASGARLNASEGMLPGSTERVLSVAGVADAIHIATYYIGNILIEANERNPHPTSTNSSYRPSSSRTRGQPPPYYPNSYAPPPGPGPGPGPGPAPGPMPHHQMQLQEQKIYIPNDLVGCIIGKGGSKINEIRHLSQCTIKIMEPGAQPNVQAGAADNERLVVVTGQPHNIQMAVSMLYHRLEQEKQKQLSSRSVPDNMR